MSEQTGTDVPDPSTWRTGDEPMTGRQAAYLETLARDAGDRPRRVLIAAAVRDGWDAGTIMASAIGT
jgi:hypothetical protein